MSLLDKLLCRTGTCPWWLCFTFDNPLRRIIQNPKNILHGLVREGDTALDIGCGMGYFSLPLADMVGSSGKVICVDLQEKMLEAVRRKAERAGLIKVMKFQQCTSDSLGLNENADFALAFWMVHEVRNKKGFFQDVRGSLKAEGTLLIVEPKLHVSRDAFDTTLSIAQAEGFKVVDRPTVTISMAALLTPVK
ncbi:MAG: class I SAM-dependent methyltransferase [Chloroflexi bacterium]|nr:class I SAM-dependent methyltransferase [Chloroflexota bacterium]